MKPSPTTMRFSTLLAKHGPIKHAKFCELGEWKKATDERRFMTVYHGESDWATPLEGMVGHHGCCNTVCKLMFTKPLPASVSRIIGMRDSQEAWELCNPQ